jgi:hypothetical protein
MKLDDTLLVRFEVSLDSIGRPSTERLDFLLSEAVIVSLLGCPFSETMASIAVWWNTNSQKPGFQFSEDGVSCERAARETKQRG